jgi:hypothetical protein
MISILFLAADPTDASRLRLGEEIRDIQERLQLAKSRDNFVLHQRMSVRPTDLSQALLDINPQIVHFSGHGESTDAIYLEDKMGKRHPLEPETLAALFEQFAEQVECVVLNACFSERQAQAIGLYIDWVIGMDRAISDKGAIAFSTGFYQALGAGRSIPDAYKLGCVQIRLQGIAEHLVPTLIQNNKSVNWSGNVHHRSTDVEINSVGLADDASIKVDWAEAIDVPVFYGRNVELETTERWIKIEQCRLVAILGMGGIGKSCFTVKLIERIKIQFEYLFWRDLRNGPPIEVVLDDCIKFLSDQKRIDIPHNVDSKFAILLEYLKQRRCLLVLDNVESILQGGENVGLYKSGFEDYGQLIRRVGSSAHQSCLLITSREQPSEIKVMESAGTRMRSLYLAGLDTQAATDLVKNKDLSGDPRDFDKLINLYGRNPLALNLASAAISDWFDKQVAAFLVDDLAVFGDIEDLIERQLKRLPEIDKEIMYWLAIQREIISMSKLEKDIMYWLVIWRDSSQPEVLEDIVRPITRGELLETLESLRRRSLLEKVDSHFGLQPVVMEYLTKQFVKHIYVEMATEMPALLKSHALVQAQAKDYILQSQIRFILKPLIERLLAAFGKEVVESKLNALLSGVRHWNRISPSYVGGNVINCLAQMSSDLARFDFSNISIWQANLKTTQLHDVNFSYSDLSRSVFAETFDLILSVAYSPNGELIAAGSAGGDIMI